MANNLEKLELHSNFKESWRRFKDEFQLYVIEKELDAKSAKVQAATLLRLMGQEARELVYTLKKSDNDLETTEAIFKLLDDYARPKSNLVHERYLFNHRKQQQGEPFDSFYLAVRKLADNCEFGTLKDSLVRDRIIYGLDDSHLRERLLGEELELSKLVSLCQSIEAGRQRAKEFDSETVKLATRTQEVSAIRNQPQSNQSKSKPQYNNQSRRFNSSQGASQRYYNSQNQGNQGQSNWQFRPKVQQNPPSNQEPAGNIEGSSDRNQQRRPCGQCGMNHPPKQCPAYGNSSKCGPFGSIENGSAQELSLSEENELRQILRITCDPGFELSGRSKLICENGVWENTSSRVCVQKCTRPPMIMNGAIEIEGRSKEDGFFSPNVKAWYMCKEGFRLSPSTSKERFCVNGSWIGKDPVCIPKECSSPETLENGYVVDKLVKEGIYTYGSKIRYDCEDGFTLKGPSIAVCNEKGEWTPDISRKCVSKIETGDTCPPPPKIPFVKYTSVEGVQTTNSILSGSVFQAHCIQGYQNVRSPCLPAIFTCLNGMWKGEVPKCEEVNSCVEPVSVSRDGLRLTDPLGSELTGPFRIGSKVMYDCSPGYVLHGEAVLTCSKSGCWEPNALPKCIPQTQLLPTFSGRPVDYVSGTLLVTLLTAVTILLILLGICLVSMRQRAPPPPITTVPPPTLLQPHPDRLALIAFTDAVQVGQSGLPSYEEATRDRFSHRFHRPPHWTQPSRRAVTRQPSSVGGDSMGSTDTMTNDSNSTNVTLDTVSSHSGSQTASCRAICGSLASFDTSSVINTEGVPLLEESEQEENVVKDNESGSYKSMHRVSPELA